MSQFWSRAQLFGNITDMQSHSGAFPSCHSLLLEVCGSFDPRFPALGFALGFSELDHEKGQNHHRSQEGEHGDGLTNFLVVATRHYP